MGFPVEAYPEAGVSDDEVTKAWTDVANIISEFEPLHMLCHTAHIERTKRLLAGSVTLHPFDYNDAWFRDSGPTFVSDNGKLKAVDWVFNGWGDNTDFDGSPMPWSRVIFATFSASRSLAPQSPTRGRYRG